MAKAVFRHGEVKISEKKVFLEAPKNFPGMTPMTGPSNGDLDELDEAEEYTGPTADDLRREAEAFKINWERERETLINSAKAEAESIIKEAETTAFQEVKRKSDQAQKNRREAEDEAERIVEEAKRTAAEIEAKAGESVENLRKENARQGFETGREEGFTEGRSEVERLIERMHTVLDRAQDKRAEILAETEQQIVDLVLLIARKVIKVISDNQRNIVVSNVVQALRKVKGHGEIVIRVNVDDLKLTSEHIKDFLKLVEGSKGMQLVEDSSVDRGGCIIETEFGEIDARISSQLAELEQKILEISPIRAKARTGAVDDR